MSDIMTAKQYTAENYLSEVDNVKSIDTLVQTQKDFQRGKRKELWPTGFPRLDEMLDGGLHGSQLCCVGAISSLGKTTWVLQIATQIAEQQKDVLIFSLEMSREELNAKTISRYSYIRGLEEWKKANYDCFQLCPVFFYLSIFFFSRYGWITLPLVAFRVQWVSIVAIVVLLSWF